MGKIWRGIVNTVFWSYERGSWPYDVLVALILVFVLLTPKRWFQDEPRPGAPAGTEVQLLAGDLSGSGAVYRLDSRLLPADKRATRNTPELERGVHEILGRTVPALNGQTFQVQRIDFVLGSDGAVLDYDVTVHLNGP